jgi:hypothetical protein
VEYLEPELRETGSSTCFRIPDQWWLGEEPITCPALQLRAGRSVERLPDFLYYDMLPIVSDRVRRVLSDLGGFRGEFHRVEVVPKGGRGAGVPYWYFRLFTQLDGVDRERSEMEFFPGTTRPKRIWQLRLAPLPTQVNVFRLEKIVAIFVSSAVRDALSSCHLRLTPAEDFRLGW